MPITPFMRGSRRGRLAAVVSPRLDARGSVTYSEFYKIECFVVKATEEKTVATLIESAAFFCLT